ncbi:hypothetical protein RJ641_013289 [Dillenia turbinata]|uniref:C2H2-type domain-containing protein n=1 Tax=Dillenia turbinata TaxID=194707 RepID=A0AAN8W5M4_9MAGN
MAAKLEHLFFVDMAKLSQSELYKLSLCSTTAFDVYATDNIVNPEIDPTIFNESAGSRKQTFTRLRRPLPPRISSAHRRRFQNPKPPTISPNDPEHSENKLIIKMLNRMIDPNGEKGNQTPDIVNNNAGGETVGYEKRRRGRKKKLSEASEMVLEIVNRNGVAVDLAVLASEEDPFGEELKRRTVGLESDEEFLGFLSGFNGHWGSRRKRRRIVDASEFGDALPVGWKLLIGLRRKDGRVSLYIRRYISPSGHQFLSCKEASSFLQSYFGLKNESRPMNDRGDNDQEQASEMQSDIHPALPYMEVDSEKEILDNSTVPSQPIEYETDSSMGIENLADVEIQDLFECHKCIMTFTEKDAYLEHLLSSHQKTTKRYRLGTSVGEGVIIKDGKYECQFCHKIFEERRQYNGHVGIHVRNYVKNFGESSGKITGQKGIDSASRDDLAPRTSRMDALIEIAQNSILETSSEGHDDLVAGDLSHEVNVASISEILEASLGHEPNTDSCLQTAVEVETTQGNQNQEPHDQCFNNIKADKMPEEIEENGTVLDINTVPHTDSISNPAASEENVVALGSVDVKDCHMLSNNLMDSLGIEQGSSHFVSIFGDENICVIDSSNNGVCTGAAEHPRDGSLEEYDINKPCIGFGGETAGPTSEENMLQSRDALSLMPMDSFHSFSATSDKDLISNVLLLVLSVQPHVEIRRKLTCY